MGGGMFGAQAATAGGAAGADEAGVGGGMGGGMRGAMGGAKSGGGDFAEMLKQFQDQAAQQQMAGGGGGGGLGAFAGGPEPQTSPGAGAFGARGGNAGSGGGMAGMFGGQAAAATPAAMPQQQQQPRAGGGAGAGAQAGAGGAGGDALMAYYNQRCQQKHGQYAEYDADSSACVCAEGFGPDDAEQCVSEGGTVEEAPSPSPAAAAAAARQAQAAAAQASAQTQTSAQAGGPAAKKAWFSQMWGGGKGGKGAGGAAGAAGGAEDTCPGGICKNLPGAPAKYQGAGAAAGAGAAIVKVDALCKHALGRGAEFDAVSPTLFPTAVLQPQILVSYIKAAKQIFV